MGEILTPVELPEPWFLVLTPACQVSTREIFNAPDLKRNRLKAQVADIKMPQFLSRVATNDCLPVVRARYPQVAEAFDFLGEYARARLTGTGASVFADFATRVEARRVLDLATPRWQGFVARGLNRSPLLGRMGSRETIGA
jgi:4-diphosphocytidyl-2-C-methyl-D-erythritol kinase